VLIATCCPACVVYSFLVLCNGLTGRVICCSLFMEFVYGAVSGFLLRHDLVASDVVILYLDTLLRTESIRLLSSKYIFTYQ
jgi:hypothetical protein